MLTFVDMFPPLCNRFKVQIVDRDPVMNDVIGTHFIDLNQIMDAGHDGEGSDFIFCSCGTSNLSMNKYLILNCEVVMPKLLLPDIVHSGPSTV